MTRTRCLVSSSCHLIPSVSLAPFHFFTYLPRSANHISIRRVTCFPVLQQPTLHDALQQIYQLALTSSRLSIARDFGYIRPNAPFFFLHVRIIRPRLSSQPSLPSRVLVAPTNSERHVLDCICLCNHRIASLDYFIRESRCGGACSHIIMLNMKRV